MEILKSKKVLFILLIILVIEMGWAAWYLQKAQSSIRQLADKAQKFKVSQSKESISLFLDPSEEQFPAGRKFKVAVILSIGQKPAIGADVILKYDPEKLTVLKITPGQVFDFYPRLEKENGQIFISAINHQEKVFSGQGILAQLTLQGKVAGEAKLKFDFTPGETTDSNVALENSQKDALEEVRNGVYTFR